MCKSVGDSDNIIRRKWNVGKEIYDQDGFVEGIDKCNMIINLPFGKSKTICDLVLNHKIKPLLDLSDMGFMDKYLLHIRGVINYDRIDEGYSKELDNGIVTDGYRYNSLGCTIYSQKYFIEKILNRS
jgi:hypothetical protein